MHELETTDLSWLPPDFPDRRAFEAEWVAALRSGEYRRGKSALRPSGEEWCCLGVGCDIAVRHGVGHGDGNAYVSHGRDTRLSVLPRWLADHLGRNDLGAPLGTPDHLSYLNDVGAPFDTIAGVIEGSIAYEDAENAAVRS